MTNKNASFEDFKEDASFTPAMAQYVETKKAHPDTLLFFQMGDFFELFFDDAVQVARALNLTLTRRGKAGGQDIPMCGMPTHASESYINRLLGKGFKVALCVQTETPETKGKAGPLKREVTKVLTPGTALNEQFLHSPQNNFLMVLAPPMRVRNKDGERRDVWGIALVDVSTGDFFLEACEGGLECAQLLTWNPKEILVPFDLLEDERLHLLRTLYKGVLRSLASARFKKIFPSLERAYGPLFPMMLENFSEVEKTAAEALVDYVETTLQEVPFLKKPQALSRENHVSLDCATRKNLEIMTSLSGESAHTLFYAMDATVTGVGKRLLAQRFQALSGEIKILQARQQAVSFWMTHPKLLHVLRAKLADVLDIERPLQRLLMGSASPKDLGALRDALIAFSCVKKVLENEDAWQQLPRGELDTVTLHTDDVLCATLQKLLHELLPRTFELGAVIKEGVDAQLDALREGSGRAKKGVQDLERYYRETLGIPTLKVKTNNMIGFHIEVATRYKAQVPENFLLKQGLAQSSRYTTEELQDIAHQLSHSDEEARVCEQKIFDTLVQRVQQSKNAFMTIAREVALLDVSSSLAHVALEKQYILPVLTQDRVFEVQGGRHPVVENALLLQGKTFEANDCGMGHHNFFWLMTGPNMAGKSTYMRQNALMIILAHVGAPVPATDATIGLVDALFSRVGASDDLARGHSTFMVEMLETAAILHQATPNSFVILDEVGRGTSTHDGLAIAGACVSYLIQHIGCRTFFSTHYLELTEKEGLLTGLECHTLKVETWENQLVFLHSVHKGKAKRSYGLEVARLAGLPDTVLQEASRTLEKLEYDKGPNPPA